MNYLAKISLLISLGWIIGFSAIAQTTCTNLLSNGDFESGGSGWNSSASATLGPTEPPLLGQNETLITNTMPRNGTLSAELGGYGGTPPVLPGYTPPFKTSIRKSVVTGNVSQSIFLTFWLKFDACHSANDFLEVVTTVDMVETVQLTLDGSNAFCGDGLWHEYSIDLSALTSSTIEIKFRTEEQGANPGQLTRFFVDDVEVEECVVIPDCPGSQFIFNQTVTGTQDFETDGQILGLNSVIAAGAIVDFDSGTSIDLGVSGNTFEVELGATFCAFIDGCNGTGGVVNPFGGSLPNNLSTPSTNQSEVENKTQILDKE